MWWVASHDGGKETTPRLLVTGWKRGGGWKAGTTALCGIPSHGEKQEWVAEGHGCSRLLRKLNDEADKKATEATEAEARPRRLAEQDNADDVARCWTSRCMGRMYKGVQSYFDAHDSGGIQKLRGIFDDQEW